MRVPSCLSVLFFMGILSGGCAVTTDGETEPESVETTEGAQRNTGKGPTRDERIAACVQVCETKYKSCPEVGPTPKNCNPQLPTDLEGNPFLLRDCKDACTRIP